MLSDCRERHLNDGLNAAVEDGGAKLPDARVQLGHHHPHPLLTVALSLLHLVDTLKSTEGRGNCMKEPLLGLERRTQEKAGGRISQAWQFLSQLTGDKEVKTQEEE